MYCEALQRYSVTVVFPRVEIMEDYYYLYIFYIIYINKPILWVFRSMGESL